MDVLSTHVILLAEIVLHIFTYIEVEMCFFLCQESNIFRAHPDGCPHFAYEEFKYGFEEKRFEMSKISKEECICCMRWKAEELGRLPKKSDFDVETVNGIKSFFGPWPRALEAAGIKEPDPLRIAKKKAKRQRARENQIRYKKMHPKRNTEKKES